jgi:plasmid stabilization system protein ParE
VKVRILPAAEAELDAIGDYIARGNPRHAMSFVRELRDKCLGLADMALAFPIVPRYEIAAYGTEFTAASRFSIAPSANPPSGST